MKTTRRTSKPTPKHSRHGQTSWERSVDVSVELEIERQTSGRKSWEEMTQEERDAWCRKMRGE